MKALTLWQPWASLIAVGVKTIETRSWAAPKSLIGQRIAIHAAKRYPAPFQDDLIGDFRIMEDIPLGAVVATVQLAGCVQVDPSVLWHNLAKRLDGSHPVENHGWGTVGPAWRWIYVADEADRPNLFIAEQERPYGDFTLGRWLWLLDDTEQLDKPLPATGRQGLWDIYI